jgi:hypothetical protein
MIRNLIIVNFSDKNTLYYINHILFFFNLTFKQTNRIHFFWFSILF